MGKTFRREKTFGPKRKSKGLKPLNNHRDLPDNQDEFGPLDDIPVDEWEVPLDQLEDYYAKTIHTESRPINASEDSKTPENNSGKR